MRVLRSTCLRGPNVRDILSISSRQTFTALEDVSTVKKKTTDNVVVKHFEG